MELSVIADEYTHKSDDELLYLSTERNTLVPEAVAALDSEIQRRGLKRQNAIRVKKRIDALSARYDRVSLTDKVAEAENERELKKFQGAEEPEYSPRFKSLGRADILNTIDNERFKFRIWKTFREHTGHWPVLSICFHYLKALLFIGGVILVIVWMENHGGNSGWTIWAGLLVFVLYYLLLDMVSRLMRRLDWKLFGEKSTDRR